jgi:hypothetical protein
MQLDPETATLLDERTEFLNDMLEDVDKKSFVLPKNKWTKIYEILCYINGDLEDEECNKELAGKMDEILIDDLYKELSLMNLTDAQYRGDPLDYMSNYFGEEAYFDDSRDNFIAELYVMIKYLIKQLGGYKIKGFHVSFTISYKLLNRIRLILETVHALSNQKNEQIAEEDLNDIIYFYDHGCYPEDNDYSDEDSDDDSDNNDDDSDKVNKKEENIDDEYDIITI